MKYITVILLLAVIFSCSKNSNPVSVNNDDISFSIYLLKDSTITGYKIEEMDIDSLELDDKSWLIYKDIEFYDFSTHCMYLKEDKSKFFKNYEEASYLFSPLFMSRPFVVVAGPCRSYTGVFHSLLSSWLPAFPCIDEIDIYYFPDDVIHISRGWISDEDIRSKQEIKDNLIKLNLFHAGLEVELTSFQLIENTDTSTVEYSIKIINNDKDDLYVIDPDKMGSKLFHYYTNGPYLHDYSKSLYIYSQYKEVDSPEPYNSWKFEWFTLVKAKQSIARTIHLKGYPHIPNGYYSAYMNFSNPRKIDKKNRYTAEGRIWIGSIQSDTIQIMIR